MIRLRWPLLILALCAPSYAFAAEPSHTPVVLSLLHPIATNHDPDVATSARLSLFYGRVGSVHGVDINGMVARTAGENSGLQVTGIFSRVDGDAKGIQVAGVGSYVLGDVHGLQFASVAQFDRGDAHGIVLSGMMNLVTGNMKGFQSAGIVNTVGKDATGIMSGGFANMVNGNAKGIVVAGGYNYVANRLSGLQASAVNYAAEAHGAQVGLANIANRAHGLQVGVFNRAEQQDGMPVGMVNLADNGKTWLLAYSSNLSLVNLGVETSVHDWYSMLTIGGVDPVGDVRETLILTWNYGHEFGISERNAIGVDLGYAHYMPKVSDDPTDNDRLHWGLQARALLRHNTKGSFGWFVGGGVSRIFDEYSSDAGGETKPMFLAGIHLW
jgi:hypothetical protein